MTLSDQIDEVLQPTIERILGHPFLVELVDGTLPHATFGRYISQNLQYLEGYARALSMLAARSTDPQLIAFFGRRAAYTVEAEQAFATDLAEAIGLDQATVLDATPTPVCLAYSSFVKQAAALEPIPVALAAMLPCYVIYNEVSKALAMQGSSDPNYQRWIEMYVGEGFTEGVTQARAALDQSSQGASSDIVDRMIQHVRYAAHYEWSYWDAAYHDRGWETAT